ncbi:glycosyltransferase [Amycolatopsis palatopharyngis]|uniref:glycosyltransferase n=1 Tax=Amycolatopsis palatopharyngis TaxID=187982 RepID=UPI000E21E408|nr:glycosyltransferase [Amycolatopsis palatopharyngis]
MLVGVCDFPGDYAFPPAGYGGIERWLWAVAVGARAAGADVHLLGPHWRPELADEWHVWPTRLEDVTPGCQEARKLRDASYDLLVVGHEYPSLPAWRSVWETLDADVATFQHWPYFEHRTDAFDGLRSRLYCYSEQMRQRYAEHLPIAELAVHLGLNEAELPARGEGELLWMGRIDRQKAPHLAIRAAGLLGQRITVAGPVFDADYVDAYREVFGAEHVRMVGEVGGEAKMHLLADASAFVYTCAPNYIEAGAASFGEALRAGTPVAALAWQTGTCAHAALCEHTGSIAQVHHDADDAIAAKALSDAIEQVLPSRAREVQEIGLSRFDPAAHFHALATRPC